MSLPFEYSHELGNKGLKMKDVLLLSRELIPFTCDNMLLTLPIRMRCSKKADHLMTSPFKASSILGISANVSVF